MGDIIDSFSLSSTYVVLGNDGDAIPIAVGDRFGDNETWIHLS